MKLFDLMRKVESVPSFMERVAEKAMPAHATPTVSLIEARSAIELAGMMWNPEDDAETLWGILDASQDKSLLAAARNSA